MSTLDTEDLETIARLVKQELHHEEPAPLTRRQYFLKHLPRRCLILGIVLAGGVVLHIIIEDTAARSVLQSCELALAAIFDAVFNKVRESI